VIAQDLVDTTVVAAFGVGFLSFISPCVLPLVPGYLSTISGVSFADLQAGKGRGKVVGPALLFCLSFTVMFVALGMTATGLGGFLAEHRLLLRKVSGVIIIALGLLFIATLFVNRLNREWRPEALMSRASTGVRWWRAWPSPWRGCPARDPRSAPSSPPPATSRAWARAACCWPSTRSAWPCHSC